LNRKINTLLLWQIGFPQLLPVSDTNLILLQLICVELSLATENFCITCECVRQLHL